MDIDIDSLCGWIGRSTVVQDVVAPWPLQALAATLDHGGEPPSMAAPLSTCWHWLHFLPLHRQSDIGDDGHARRGGFLPPVPLPGRMWAGSRIDVLQPPAAGQAVERCSTIDDVSVKQGRSGPLVFVRVRHEVSAEGRPAVRELHDIVYRRPPAPGEPGPGPAPAPAGAAWSRRIHPDPVLLFRYSALTFNGHRIHYDHPYATQTEGYPGLVVHGPLIATLLLDLLQREMPQARVRQFTFKAVAPLFDTAPFDVCGRPLGDGQVLLWACTPEGRLAMQASATLA